MEETNERKKRFVILLEGLLLECGGVKGKLAEQLNIKPSRLTHWLQGKIDPASLDAIAFIRLAKQKNISVNQLAIILGINLEQNENSLEEKFKTLIEQLLINKSQEELAERLGVKRSAISSWITPTRQIDPANINIATMAAIAFEKGWTIERLFIYLGLKDFENEEDLQFRLKSITTTLSLPQQVDLLAWLSTIVGKTVKDSSFLLDGVKNKCNLQLYLVFEKENIEIASFYANNLGIHFQIPADNITIATITQFEEVKEDFDLIIFDIETNSSNIIDRINQISFNGNIVIFTSPDLEEEVRQQLEDKVTDIVVKPIDWNSLKDKPYFMNSESKGTN